MITIHRKPEISIKYFSKALQSQKTRGVANAGLGLIYYQASELNNAIKYFHEVNLC